ncbi:catalase [Robbsia sp. KACC 23696]|uniref:catalase n=1 Tax=Robbsia sp. KACC 23696 TaxID=3149231 RepID=UPI00325BB581
MNASPALRRFVAAAISISLIGAAQADSLPRSASAPARLTRDNGAPVGENRHSQTAGPDGPVLLQDANLIQKLQRFDRERIPERVVHARGTGAHGVFVATRDISALTRASVFTPGRETPVFVRFSAVIHSKDSPEYLRDPRGFATKFYTREGNWDLVGNNLPIFFIRDAMQFPDMVHSLKPAPDTNVQDPNRYFDFFARHPESTHMLTQLYSDAGTPASYGAMDGDSVHAYKFVNAAGETRYVKFHWKSMQRASPLSASAARAKDFNYLTLDLLANIDARRFPQWQLQIQTLQSADFAALDFDPLDATKIWPARIAPYLTVGVMTLNRNPDNVFNETEQAAFAPSNLVPGIEPSEDRLLQGRLFSYADTQLHRVGTNALQLPINRPVAPVADYNIDGAMNSGGNSGAGGTALSAARPESMAPMPSHRVNYEGAAAPVTRADTQYRLHPSPLRGTSQQVGIEKTADFQQAGDFYRALSRAEKTALIDNLIGDLGQVRSMKTKQTMVAYFTQADAAFGARLSKRLGLTQARFDETPTRAR